MTSFLQSPYYLKNLLTAWLFFLLLLFIYVLFRLMQQRRSLKLTAPLLLLYLPLDVVWQFLADVTDISLYKAPWALRFCRIPAAAIAVLNAAVTVLVAVLLVFVRRRQQRRVDETSIKESFDFLPAGICFYRTTGRVYMYNHQMDALSFAVTGSAMQNGALFWNALISGGLPEGVSRLTDGDEPILRLPDGRIWRFTRFPVKNEPLFELIAVDVTDLYLSAERLREKNEALRDFNRRLREYGENVTALTRNEEILTAKAQIHARMNRLLLSTVHCVEDGGTEEDYERVFSMWQGNVLLLCREETPGLSSPIAELQEAAASIGMALDFEGLLPEDNARALLVMLATGEALTNARRHAGATVLHVSCGERGAVFTNDGRPPEGEVREGGGLGEVRREAERLGAVMRVETCPVFRLTLSF